MINRLLVVCVTCLLAFTTPAMGQDVIYQKDGNQLLGSVSLIADEWISFRTVNQRTASPKQVNKAEVLLLFYEDGDYLIFHADLQGGYHRVAFDNEYYDKLITRDGKVIPVEESTVFSTEVHYRHLLDNEQKKKIPVKEVLAILYRDKSHKFLASTPEVAKTLSKIHELPAPDINVAVVPTSNPTPVNNVGNETSEIQPVSDVSPVSSSTASATAERLPVNEEAFKRKATERTQELTHYIQLISDKHTSPYEANKGIDQAVKLFTTDTCIVEVSSKNSESLKRYSIRNYLQHIKLLKYDKVEVSWVEVNYVGDIRKGTDGNYYGYVTFVQIFRGFKDGKVMYEDMTEKRVEVMLKGYTKFEEGKSLELWDVLLSNIKVEETI